LKYSKESRRHKFFFELLAIALMMEAARTPETSVNFYQTTWRNNPEDSHLRATTSLRRTYSRNGALYSPP
jgi:hypothetical protein